MPCRLSCGRGFCPGALAQLRSIAGRVTCATQIGPRVAETLGSTLLTAKIREFNLVHTEQLAKICGPRPHVWTTRDGSNKVEHNPHHRNLLRSEIEMVGIHWLSFNFSKPSKLDAGIAERPVPLPMLDSKAGHAHTHPRMPQAKQRRCIMHLFSQKSMSCTVAPWKFASPVGCWYRLRSQNPFPHPRKRPKLGKQCLIRAVWFVWN